MFLFIIFVNQAKLPDLIKNIYVVNNTEIR